MLACEGDMVARMEVPSGDFLLEPKSEKLVDYRCDVASMLDGKRAFLFLSQRLRPLRRDCLTYRRTKVLLHVDDC